VSSTKRMKRKKIYNPCIFNKLRGFVKRIMKRIA
jgi:hypothetical protein